LLAAPGIATTLINAEISGCAARSLRLLDSRIVGIGVQPQSHDRVLDLHGDRVLPGLINAHDHLQLNGFPRLMYRARYDNASQWIADLECRLDRDPGLLAQRAVARSERLFLGGIKNLLSGVTTVAHHDPLQQCLTEAGFPTQVLAHYGWSHSLLLDGASAVRRSHRATPASQPWIIHAAEGTDAQAAAEFAQLGDLGCISANTLLVHGIALNGAQRAQLAGAGAGLIWCPSSNLNLYGSTAQVAELLALRRVALGSDSRISGARDLLGELAVARESSALDEATLQSLVTDSAAALLRLRDRGVLRVGAQADILVLPAGQLLTRASRADVRLVMVNGRACYGEPHYALPLQAPGSFTEVRVDGHDKVLARALLERLAQSQLREVGLEWPEQQLRGRYRAPRPQPPVCAP
jgi:cytosine/adenosine deaminase-related metal-dependent hydrolase